VRREWSATLEERFTRRAAFGLEEIDWFKVKRTKKLEVEEAWKPKGRKARTGAPSVPG
jgi:hypothetical protein